MVEKACPTCHLIIQGNKCPICKTTSSLSDDFSGLVIVFNPEESVIAKAMNAKQKGSYAIKVR